jgi:ribose transport system ATP-binding protein
MREDCILRAENIVKSFYGNRVLDGVELSLKVGKVHALCGENGAGKSTLLKIITGLYTKDSGSIYMDGKEIEVTNVETAKKYGIHVVPQEMQILRELTVAENIFLGNPPRTRLGTIDWKTMNNRSNELKRLLGKHGEKLDVQAKAGKLGMGAWQLIEIMRAFTSENLRVIAFDEPTASLSDSEANALFELIQDLKKRGIAIVYVSHRMKEIFHLCDEVSIFRDGQYVGTRQVSETTNNELIAMMIGRDVELFGEKSSHNATQNRVIMKAEHFSHGKAYQDVSIELHEGEILGMYGLVGAGRTEFVRGLFGIDSKSSGELEINGEKIIVKSPRDAIRAGIGLVTEDRREEGLMLSGSLKWNLSMTNLDAIMDGFHNLNLKKEKDYAEEGMRIFNVKATDCNMKAGNLSGGNQQKIVLAKWIMKGCRVLIVDEPTRGIDVGAKAEVYHTLKQLAKEGTAIIMVSSELPEIIGVSDRIIVMCEGKVTAELQNDGLNEEDVIQYAFSS